MRTLLAILLFAGTANAQPYPFRIGVGGQLEPQTSQPFASGKAGVWVSLSDGNLYFHKSDNTNFNITLGGNALSLQSATTVVDVSASAAPAAKYALVGIDSTHATWRRLTADDIAAGFSITGFAGGGTYASAKELGASMASPTFTASYSSLPASATITDGALFSTLTLTTPFTSGTEAHTYSRSTPGAITWTLRPIAGSNPTATVSTTYSSKVFYGVATPSTIDSAFVLALPSSVLQSGATGTFAVGAGSGTKKFYEFFDASISTPTIFKDAGTGFGVPTTCALSVSVTNAQSVVRTFTGCVSDEFLSSAFNEQVQ